MQKHLSKEEFELIIKYRKLSVVGKAEAHVRLSELDILYPADKDPLRHLGKGAQDRSTEKQPKKAPDCEPDPMEV